MVERKIERTSCPKVRKNFLKFILFRRAGKLVEKLAENLAVQGQSHPIYRSVDRSLNRNHLTLFL